jgi:hypothetical protein
MGGKVEICPFFGCGKFLAGGKILWVVQAGAELNSASNEGCWEKF